MAPVSASRGGFGRAPKFPLPLELVAYGAWHIPRTTFPRPRDCFKARLEKKLGSRGGVYIYCKGGGEVECTAHLE